MPLTEEGYKETLASAMAARRRQLRNGAGETQEEVARAIDVPLSVYRGWETGRSAPRGVAWLRLCEHFDWPHPLRSGDSEPNLWLAQMVPDQPVSVPAPPTGTARSKNLAEAA